MAALETRARRRVVKAELKLVGPGAVLFIDAAASGVLAPHLGELTDHVLDGRSGAGARLAMLAAIFAGQALLGPASAQLVRVLPWQIVCAGGFIFFGAGLWLVLGADSFMLLLCALMLPGLSVATTIVALSALSRHAAPSRRTKRQALGFAIIAAGFVLAPVVSGFTLYASLTQLLTFAIAICAFGAVVSVLSLVISSPSPDPAQAHAAGPKAMTAAPGAAVWIAAFGAAGLAASSQPFTLMWPLVGGEAFDLTPAAIGVTFALVAALTAVFNLFLIKRIAFLFRDRLGAFLLGVAGLYAIACWTGAAVLFLPIAACVAVISCAPSVLSGQAMENLGAAPQPGAMEAVNTVFFYAGAGGALFGAASAFLLYDQSLEILGRVSAPALMVSVGSVLTALAALRVSARLYGEPA